MKRKHNGKYIKKFKANAIRLVLDGGQSVYGAAKELDMPKSTLADWIKRAKVEKLATNDTSETVEAETELDQLMRELAQVKEDRDRLAKALIESAEMSAAEIQGEMIGQTEEVMTVPPYDEMMLDQAREYWRYGDWGSLTEMESGAIHHHPDRAKLALLIAAGHQQVNDLIATRKWVRMAKEWGGDKKLIARILIAGVHNTLGRAAAVSYWNEQRSYGHFKDSIAIGMPGTSIKIAIQKRIGQEVGQVSLGTNQTNEDTHQFAKKIRLRHAGEVFGKNGFNRKHWDLEQLRHFLGSRPVFTNGDNNKQNGNSAFLLGGKAIFVVGMRHSGSTALFNIVRIILKKKQVNFSSYYSENEQQKKHRKSSDQLRLIKTHEFRDDHLADAIAIVSARRDIRDTVASALRRNFFLLKNIGGAVEYAKYNRTLHDIWLPHSDYCFVYEEFISDPITAIDAVLAFLGVADLDSREIYEELLNLPTDQYDTTLLSPTHITDPERKLTFRDTLDGKSLAKINSNHAAWLRKYGYRIIN